mgnify:FL=1
MKNKKKVWIIGLCFIIAGYFALSLCDFMYIRADKYPTFIRTIFFPDDKNITVKSMGNVCQVEDGIYFLYQGRLMNMDNEGKAVKEAYSNQQPILGIMKNNSDIFLCYENISALYKINDNKNKSSSDNGKNEIELLIKEGGDRYYIDGKYIYFFDDDMLNKYTLDGNKVYSSKVYYTPRPILGRGSIIFNGYSICINGYRDSNATMGVDIPCYYLFGWNRVRYKQKRLGIIQYYKEASPWDHHWQNPSNIKEYDTWTKNLDYEIRNSKVLENGRKDEDTLDPIKYRNMEEYELVSIELYDSNPNFYRISEGYVYFAQQLEICYRDKKYKDKIVFDDRGNVNEKEREKIEFRVYPQAMLRVKLEDTENARENEKLEYEVINIQRYIRNFIENYEVDGNFVYSLSNGNYSIEEEKTKVFIIDINTGTTIMIYSKPKNDENSYMPQLFCSDNYVFLYEYSNKEGEEGCRITRFDKDGKNPVLVIDYTGEVVMKPVAPVQ